LVRAVRRSQEMPSAWNSSSSHPMPTPEHETAAAHLIQRHDLLGEDERRGPQAARAQLSVPDTGLSARRG
jgi:hypothetical protein